MNNEFQEIKISSIQVIFKKMILVLNGTPNENWRDIFEENFSIKELKCNYEFQESTILITEFSKILGDLRIVIKILKNAIDDTNSYYLADIDNDKKLTRDLIQFLSKI